MKRLIFAGLLLFSTPVWAEDVSVHTLCQMLPEYRADPSVAYTPGSTVDGRMVIPADVNKFLKNDFDAVDIPIKYSVLQGLNVAPPPGVEAKPLVAMLRIYHDGRVQYNGNDVTPQAQQLCTLRQPARSSVTIQ